MQGSWKTFRQFKSKKKRRETQTLLICLFIFGFVLRRAPFSSRHTDIWQHQLSDVILSAGEGVRGDGWRERGKMESVVKQRTQGREEVKEVEQEVEGEGSRPEAVS